MLISRRMSFVLAALLALAAVILLGQVPSWNEGMKKWSQDVTVFAPLRVEALSDDNLVDALIRLPLQERLRRVSWDHSILTIDLTESDSSDVWEHTRELILFSFDDMHNVRQLLLRLFNEKHGDTLLMAVETRKSDWTHKQLSRLGGVSGFGEAEISGKIRTLITPAGQLWLRNFANR